MEHDGARAKKNEWKTQSEKRGRGEWRVVSPRKDSLCSESPPGMYEGLIDSRIGFFSLYKPAELVPGKV